jgi:hypothetical protein
MLIFARKLLAERKYSVGSARKGRRRQNAVTDKPSLAHHQKPSEAVRNSVESNLLGLPEN